MVKKIPFGPADIFIGEGENEVRFDGVIGSDQSELQAEGGTITIEPRFTEINSIDYGGQFDDMGTGVNVNVTIIALHESVRTLKMAMANVQEITDGAGGDVTGVTDAPVGESNRDKGVKVRIHPRNMGTDLSHDYTIYKMAPVENFERTFSLEQGTIQIQYKAYPRDGADPSKGANFFYTGAVDPNAGEE